MCWPIYCKFGYFHEGLIFARFREINSSRNGEITLTSTDIGKSFPSPDINRRKCVF